MLGIGGPGPGPERGGGRARRGSLARRHVFGRQDTLDLKPQRPGDLSAKVFQSCKRRRQFPRRMRYLPASLGEIGFKLAGSSSTPISGTRMG